MRKSAVPAFICVLAFAGMALATTYTGTLTSSGGGVTGQGDWASAITFGWTADDTSNPGFWTYSYTFTDGKKALSHMIIEVSSDSTWDDFVVVSGNAAESSDSPRIWSATEQGNSNPGLPEPFFGAKFIPTAPAPTPSITVTFTSDRVPVWGDFYVKDGANDPVNAAWNSGFSLADPTVAASDGSVSNHILVPDTQTIHPVPEPLSMLFFGTGLVGVAGFVARKRMQWG